MGGHAAALYIRRNSKSINKRTFHGTALSTCRSSLPFAAFSLFLSLSGETISVNLAPTRAP